MRVTNHRPSFKDRIHCGQNVPAHTHTHFERKYFYVTRTIYYPKPHRVNFFYYSCGQMDKWAGVFWKWQIEAELTYSLQTLCFKLFQPLHPCVSLFFAVKKSQFSSRPGCFNPHRHQRERWSIHCTWPSLSRLMSPSAQGPLNWRTTFFPPSVSSKTPESH